MVGFGRSHRREEAGNDEYSSGVWNLLIKINKMNLGFLWSQRWFEVVRFSERGD